MFLKSPVSPKKKPVCASFGLCAGSRPGPRTERQRAFVAGASVRDRRRSASDNVLTTAFCSFGNIAKPPLYLGKVDFRQYCRKSKTDEIKTGSLNSPNFLATLPKGARKKRHAEKLMGMFVTHFRRPSGTILTLGICNCCCFLRRTP